jgi:hypothetical protein
MPLTSGGTTNAGQAEQQELPAWLESLRAHERPASSGLSEQRQPFSMAELVDENSMPSWMRQDYPRTNEGGSSDSFPALSATEKPGPALEQQTFPASGLEAGSLIDEQSLPAWMRGEQGGAGQNISAQSLVQPEALPAWMREGQGGAQPATGQGQSMSASNLVQPEALPAWMKSLEQAVQPETTGRPLGQQYGLPPSSPPVTPPSLSSITPMPQTPKPGASRPLAQGFSAGELIDQQSLPAWMTGAQGPGPQPPSRPTPTGQGFAAGELIDQQSLPRWMTEQQGQEKTNPQSAMGVPVSGSGQMTGMGQTTSSEGMPASTLLDMNSLPAWMREGAQEGTQGTQQPGSMSAGSLIDLNEMPAWLRNADQPQQSGGTRGAPARPVVPGRPRTEANPQEQSEVAANVFASMLGVAASAPALPGQEQQMPGNNLGVAQGQPAQPVPPTWQPPQQPAMNQGTQPQNWQMSGSLPRVSAAPLPNMYTPGGQAGNVGGMQPRPLERPPYVGSTEMGRAGAGASMNMGGGREARPKKKSLFDSIREFFSK